MSKNFIKMILSTDIMVRYGLAITVSPWKTLIGRVPCSTFDALNPPPNRCIFCM